MSEDFWIAETGIAASDASSPDQSHDEGPPDHIIDMAAECHEPLRAEITVEAFLGNRAGKPTSSDQLWRDQPTRLRSVCARVFLGRIMTRYPGIELAPHVYSDCNDCVRVLSMKEKK